MKFCFEKIIIIFIKKKISNTNNIVRMLRFYKKMLRVIRKSGETEK